MKKSWKEVVMMMPQMPENVDELIEKIPQLPQIPDTVIQAFSDAGAFLTMLWLDWHIGTICALISLVFIIKTDGRMVKEFWYSRNRLFKWPKLLFHTIARVIYCICIYFGPIWTVEMIFKIWNMSADKVYDALVFLILLPRWYVVLGTTILVVAVFLLATFFGIRSYRRRKRARRMPRTQVIYVPQAPQSDGSGSTAGRH